MRTSRVPGELFAAANVACANHGKVAWSSASFVITAEERHCCHGACDTRKYLRRPSWELKAA